MECIVKICYGLKVIFQTENTILKKKRFPRAEICSFSAIKMWSVASLHPWATSFIYIYIYIYIYINTHT